MVDAMGRPKAVLGALGALLAVAAVLVPASAQAACGSGNLCGYDSDYYNGTELFENDADGGTTIDFANNRLESVISNDASDIGWVEADGWPDRTVHVTTRYEDIRDWGIYGLDNQIDHAYEY